MTPMEIQVENQSYVKLFQDNNSLVTLKRPTLIIEDQKLIYWMRSIPYLEHNLILPQHLMKATNGTT